MSLQFSTWVFRGPHQAPFGPVGPVLHQQPANTRCAAVVVYGNPGHQITAAMDAISYGGVTKEASMIMIGEKRCLIRWPLSIAENQILYVNLLWSIRSTRVLLWFIILMREATFKTAFLIRTSAFNWLFLLCSADAKSFLSMNSVSVKNNSEYLRWLNSAVKN